MEEEKFSQEDFEQVVRIENAIVKAIFPFSANTPTRLAIFALGRVLKALLKKCPDQDTRTIYVAAILNTLNSEKPVDPGSPIIQLGKYFH